MNDLCGQTNLALPLGCRPILNPHRSSDSAVNSVCLACVSGFKLLTIPKDAPLSVQVPAF